MPQRCRTPVEAPVWGTYLTLPTPCLAKGTTKEMGAQTSGDGKVVPLFRLHQETTMKRIFFLSESNTRVVGPGCVLGGTSP